MERYLLFDSGCLVCSGLAAEIEQAGGGWLGVRSLRSAEVQRHLDRAAPGWKWVPMLLEIDGESVAVHKGIDMRRRIAAGVGPRTAWAIAKLVQRAGNALTEAQTGHRNLLRGRAGVITGAVLGLTAWPAFGRETVDDQPVPLAAPSLVDGARAGELAAKALASRDMANLLTHHRVADKQGTVHEHSSGTGRADWSVVFPAEGGGFITYVARPGGQIRTQAVYDRDRIPVAVSVDGMLSRTIDQPLGPDLPEGARMMDSCTESGCSMTAVNRCKRCCSTCSSYRSTDDMCCVCTTPGGGTYVMSCRTYAYGPCGMC